MSGRGCFGVRYRGCRDAPGPACDSPPAPLRPADIPGLKVASTRSACCRGAVRCFVLVGGVL